MGACVHMWLAGWAAAAHRRNPQAPDVLLTASGDTTVRVWDVRQPAPSLVLPAHGHEVSALPGQAARQHARIHASRPRCDIPSLVQARLRPLPAPPPHTHINKWLPAPSRPGLHAGAGCRLVQVQRLHHGHRLGG